MSVTGLQVSVLSINNNEYKIKDAESRNDITLINEAIQGLGDRVEVLELGGVSGTIDLHLSSNYAPSTGTNNALELVSGDSYEHAFGKLEKSLSDTEYIMSRTMIDINTRLETLESGSISGPSITPQDLELSDEYAASTSSGSALNLVSGTTYEEAFSKLEKKINDTNTELGNINIPDNTLSDEYAASTSSGSALTLVSGTTYEEAFSKLEKKINDTNTELGNINIPDNTLSDEYATSTSSGSTLNLVSGTTYEEAFSKLEKKINDTNTELGNINIPDNELSDEYATSTGTGSALTLVSGTTYEEAFSKLEKKINDNDLKIPTPTISDNNKVLMVVSGSYQLVLPSILYSGTGAPNNANGNNGDIYVQTSGE